jgi:lysophospholipase L1-like esterase
MNQIYLIGDSTVTDNEPPFRGWGWALPQYVREGVTVHNHAESGRSTRSFLEEGLWAPVEAGLQPGDLLMIQFGHNDEKDDERHTDPDTTFSANLRLFAEAALKKGAYPVLITPIARRLFDEAGNFRPGSHGAYPDAVRRTARELGIPLIDLTGETEAYLARLGDEPSKPLFMFPKDNTHLKPEGAVVMAGFLARGLEKEGAPYAGLLAHSDEGAHV